MKLISGKLSAIAPAAPSAAKGLASAIAPAAATATSGATSAIAPALARLPLPPQQSAPERARPPVPTTPFAASPNLV